MISQYSLASDNLGIQPLSISPLATLGLLTLSLICLGWSIKEPLSHGVSIHSRPRSYTGRRLGLLNLNFMAMPHKKKASIPGQDSWEAQHSALWSSLVHAVLLLTFCSPRSMETPPTFQGSLQGVEQQRLKNRHPSAFS